MRLLPRTVGFVAILSALALVAACSSDASTRSDSSPTTTSAAPVELPEEIPEGVTLRIGDQFEYLQTILEIGGQAEDFAYDIDYSSFLGGPPMLQAFQAGELDAGFIGTTPLIFAQAADQSLRGVAAWASEHGSFYRLVTAPGVDDIDGWADLEGRSVAFQKGTANEAALLQGLESVGLELSDVTVVDVTSIQITATLEGGSADTAIHVEPLVSAYLANNPTARVVETPSAITDRTQLLITTDDLLDDDGKTAALADYLSRLVRAVEAIRTGDGARAAQVFEQVYGLTPERSQELLEENGQTAFYEIPGDLLDQQQKLADLFFENDQIPARIDVAGSFDTRFNVVVEREQE